MSKEKHTPGPWAWFGNATTNSLYLATTHSGRRFVMDFTRWGFRGAQPRFQAERGIMIDAKDLLQFQVGDQSIVGVEAAKKDGSVYRLDVRGINSADARLIAAAPKLKDALAAMLDFWGGYECPEVDTAIAVMQEIGEDRWSMQAQMEAEAEALPLHEGSGE